jgi:hypothetical protein
MLGLSAELGSREGQEGHAVPEFFADLAQELRGSCSEEGTTTGQDRSHDQQAISERTALYSRLVAPHLLATFTAYTGLPLHCSNEYGVPSDSVSPEL